MNAITVPVPPLDCQIWFNTLQAKVARIRTLHAEASEDAERLMTLMLDRAFRDPAASDADPGERVSARAAACPAED